MRPTSSAARRRLSEFNGRSRFSTWLHPIAVHAACDACREAFASTRRIVGGLRGLPATIPIDRDPWRRIEPLIVGPITLKTAGAGPV